MVGSMDQWKDEYGTHVSHRKNVRRYIEEGDSAHKQKLQLELSRDRFVPNSYLSYVNNEKDDASGPVKKVVIPSTKLFELPQLPNNRSSRLKVEDNIADSISLK